MSKPTKTETSAGSSDKERITELEGEVQSLESELNSEMALALTRVQNLAKLETEVNDWKSLAVRIASTLTEITEQRISHMLTESRMAEIIRQNNSVLFNIAGELRAMLGKE